MEERFTDGNMADVVRIGSVVKKQRPPWWPATRQVLEHLQKVRFRWSPEVVGESSKTVDLTYIPGHTIGADLDGNECEQMLIAIGRLAREFHDNMESFKPDPETAYVPWPISPDETTIVCHNDISPWNVVIEGDQLRGLIDWDLVSPGTREWELAWICWRWAPIYPGGARTGFNAEEQAQRCRILIEAYGLDALRLNDFVHLIDMRMECALEVVERLGADGVPGFSKLLETGMHLSGHDDRAWLAKNHEVFRRYLQTD